MNQLFRAINKIATPKRKPSWGSPEWIEQERAWWDSVKARGGVFDIESLDPLNHRTAEFGHDELVEREEREQDYEGGMK